MKLADPAAYVDDFLALEFEASEPYATFVYESPEHAKAIARFLLESSAGEMAAPHGQVVVDEKARVTGILAFLDGDELGRARTQAAMALIRGRKIDPRGPVRERMLIAGETLCDVEPDDLYLSRIAVAARARGKGVATWLLEEYKAAARARGKRRLILEVSPVHAAAVRLYERFGFGSTGEHRASDPATGRELIYLHMVKAL